MDSLLKKRFTLAKIQKFTMGTLVGGTIACISAVVAKNVTDNRAGWLATYMLTATGMTLLAAPIMNMYDKPIAEWVVEPIDEAIGDLKKKMEAIDD
jgi:hypothetical protein